MKRTLSIVSALVLFAMLQLVLVLLIVSITKSIPLVVTGFFIIALPVAALAAVGMLAILQDKGWLDRPEDESLAGPVHRRIRRDDPEQK